MNINLNIDEEISQKVRKIAIEKDTTLTRFENNDAAEHERRVLSLEDSFKRLSRDMGPRNWKREDLHSR